ncbi:MAG: hypothetical protein HC805_02440 [Alkalinema sp. RL_2_19]|nr:hypothetical protein [Alkalinema sp. RL_2_19]
MPLPTCGKDGGIGSNDPFGVDIVGVPKLMPPRSTIIAASPARAAPPKKEVVSLISLCPLLNQVACV